MTAGPLVYVSKVVRLPLVDSEGVTIGRVDDVLLGPPAGAEPPRVLGFVAVVQRRRIFVNAGRVVEVDPSGVRLHSGTIDLRHFELRSGELLARARLLDARMPEGGAGGGDRVIDIGLRASPDRERSWEVATVALGGGGALRRRASRVVAWHEVADLFDAGPLAGQVARLRELHPSDVARAVRALPAERRRQLAELMEVEELADVLEELPEAEQVRIIEGLALERAADVLEEMAPDDAADLLAELPGDERARLLEAMEPDEAGPLRRLLVYDEKTAGGLMTPEPVIVPPETTVAETLARLRDRELAPALAAQVFVVRSPTTTPTGRFVGVVGFQRLLREPPGMAVGRCLDEAWDPIPPELSEIHVAERLAMYNLLALPVCDREGRLLGAVSVDDVLDRTLPAGWRQR